MLFRQIFDSVSATYTYLLAAHRGAEALIIDPVLEKVDQYLRLMDELDLKLVKAIDTHMHADHLSGLGALRDATRCITVMGEENPTDVVSMRLHDANIPGSVHAPYAALDQYFRSGGLLQFEATTGGKRLIFFCSFGERSAMAVEADKEAGLENVASVVGGIKAWMKVGSPVVYDETISQDGGGT